MISERRLCTAGELFGVLRGRAGQRRQCRRGRLQR